MNAAEKELFALHAAIDTPGLCTATRDLLRALFPCVRVTLFLGHIGMGEARVVYTDPPIERAAEWFEERGKLNPFSPWIEKHLGAPYYRFSDIVGPPPEFRKSEFYRRVAQVEGWDKGISGIFWNRREVRAMFSIYRGPRQKDFSEAEIELLLHWMRHIEIAVIRVQKINREQNFRSAFETFSRNMPVPLMLLDWEGKVVFSNRAAQESAAVWNLGPERARSYNSRDAFRVPGVVQAEISRLREVIAAMEPKSLARHLPATVRVEQPGRAGHSASITPTQYGHGSLARPGFFVLFLDRELASEADGDRSEARRIQDLARLTPAERELVTQICRGLRNAEIAQELSKSVLTVKTQLNSIFQKLEVRSRAELITRFR